MNRRVFLRNFGGLAAVVAAAGSGPGDKYSELACIDCSRMRGWPVINAFSTDKARADVRERARVNLLRVIDAGIEAVPYAYV